MMGLGKAGRGFNSPVRLSSLGHRRRLSNSYGWIIVPSRGASRKYCIKRGDERESRRVHEIRTTRSSASLWDTSHIPPERFAEGLGKIGPTPMAWDPHRDGCRIPEESS